MPVYEYRCKHCGQHTDRLLPHEQAGEPGPCPSCEQPGLERRFSRVAVRYESWGFNATDRLVGDRAGRNDFRTVRERAERIAEGE